MKGTIDIQTLAAMTEREFGAVHAEMKEANGRIDKVELVMERGFREVYARIDAVDKSTNARIDRLEFAMVQGFKEMRKAIDNLALAIARGFKDLDGRIVRLEKHVGLAE